MSHSVEQHTKKLLDLMPNGELMKDKHDTTTNHYKWWQAVAMYFILIENDWAKVIDELGISTTESLIERWESEYGIPDGIIEVAASLEDRRNNILLKKSGLNLLPIADFQDLADRLGLAVTFYTSQGRRFPPYSVPFYPLGDPMYKFIVFVEGDLDDPYILSVIYFFETLLPINVGIIPIDV